MATLTAPPDTLAPEWPGHALGISNVVTRTRWPALRMSGERERLALHAQRALEGKHVHIEDAVFDGFRVRLFTTSHHLADFWREYTCAPGEWLEATGRTQPQKPDAAIFAVGRDPEIAEGVYEFPGEGYVINTSRFGDLRAAAERLLSGKGIVAASAVEIDGRGILLQGAAGTGKSWATLALLERGATFVGDGLVAFDETSVRRVERALYLPAALVESFPRHAWTFLQGKFENAPDATAGPGAAALEDAVLEVEDPPAQAYFRSLPKGALRTLLSRLTAYEAARAIAPAERIVPRRRVKPFGEPVRIHAVALLRRDPKDDTVLGPGKSPLPAAAYEVNTALPKSSRREAALAIAKVLERLARETPRDPRCTVNDVTRFVEGP